MFYFKERIRYAVLAVVFISGMYAVSMLLDLWEFQAEYTSPLGETTIIIEYD